MDSVDTEHSHCHRKVYWTALDHGISGTAINTKKGFRKKSFQWIKVNAQGPTASQQEPAKKYVMEKLCATEKTKTKKPNT